MYVLDFLVCVLRWVGWVVDIVVDFVCLVLLGDV